MEQRWVVEGNECLSVDPRDWDPLRSGGHQIYSLLQQADGVVYLIVDDGLVKVVSIGPLQHLRLLLQPLKRVILREKKLMSVLVTCVRLHMIQLFRLRPYFKYIFNAFILKSK